MLTDRCITRRNSWELNIHYFVRCPIEAVASKLAADDFCADRLSHTTVIAIASMLRLLFAKLQLLQLHNDYHATAPLCPRNWQYKFWLSIVVILHSLRGPNIERQSTRYLLLALYWYFPAMSPKKASKKAKSKACNSNKTFALF